VLRISYAVHHIHLPLTGSASLEAGIGYWLTRAARLRDPRMNDFLTRDSVFRTARAAAFGLAWTGVAWNIFARPSLLLTQIAQPSG
jgi:hypothetical protein